MIAPLERWTDKEQTQAEVEFLILDHIFASLPSPPFTDEEKQEVAKRVYQHVWQQSVTVAARVVLQLLHGCATAHRQSRPVPNQIVR